MSRRALALETAALLVGLATLEAGALLLELRTAVIRDWFVALAPLLWVNASAAVLYLLGRGLAPGGEAGGPGRGWTRLLWPRFSSLQARLGDPSVRVLWLALGVGYGAAFLLLQGMLILDPTGGLPAVGAVLTSPVGYGPGIAWSPHPTVGLLLRPYSTAALVALSVLSGLVLALFVSVVRGGTGNLRSLTGPVAGLGVLCPACFATPATGLAVAYLAPAVALAGLGTTSLFAFAMGVATGVLLLSLLFLWMTLSYVSRLERSGL